MDELQQAPLGSTLWLPTEVLLYLVPSATDDSRYLNITILLFGADYRGGWLYSSGKPVPFRATAQPAMVAVASRPPFLQDDTVFRLAAQFSVTIDMVQELLHRHGSVQPAVRRLSTPDPGTALKIMYASAEEGISTTFVALRVAPAPGQQTRTFLRDIDWACREQGLKSFALGDFCYLY